MPSESDDGLQADLEESQGEGVDCLTLDELQTALGQLSGQDLKRLSYSAKFMTSETNLTADELVSEAIHAAVVGRRNCPRKVAITKFLMNVMRSLAWSAKKGAARSPIVHLHPRQPGADDPIERVPDPGPDPEQALLERTEQQETAIAARSAVGILTDHFSDDYEAQLCLAGMLDELEGKELRELLGVDQAGLDYAKKRIFRALRKLFPRGWSDVHR